MDYEIVWLKEYRRFGFLLSRGAHYSVCRVEQTFGWDEVLVENDEYDYWEERAIEFEADE